MASGPRNRYFAILTGSTLFGFPFALLATAAPAPAAPPRISRAGVSRPVLEKVRRRGAGTADEREGRLRAVSRPIYGSQKFIGSISAIFKRLEAKSSPPPSRSCARADFAEIFLLLRLLFVIPARCNKIVMSLLPSRGSRAFLTQLCALSRV